MKIFILLVCCVCAVKSLNDSGTRCKDQSGNSFPSGALYYSNKRDPCTVLLCKKDGTSQLVFDLCLINNSAGKNRHHNQSCTTAAADHVSNNELLWQTSSAGGCQLVLCVRGRLISQLNITCQPSDTFCSLIAPSDHPSCCRSLPECDPACVPPVACPDSLQRLYEGGRSTVRECRLMDGRMGVICRNNSSRIISVPIRSHPHQCPQLQRSKLNLATRQLLRSTPAENADDSELQLQLFEAVQADGGAGLRRAEKQIECELNKLPALEKNLADTGKVPNIRGSSVNFGLNFRNSIEAYRNGRVALKLSRVASLVLSSNTTHSCHYNHDELDCRCAAVSSRVKLPDFPCEYEEVAPGHNVHSIYRTADGSWNNLLHPRWGSRLTRLRRIFPNTYTDGVHEPTSYPGLPSARYISEKVMDSVGSVLQYKTMAMMTFGQFIDHDLSHTPIAHTTDNEEIECCIPSTQPPATPPIHPFCFPIEIHQNDSFYGGYGQRCMNFVRSVIAKPSDCSLTAGEQLNDINHWLDGSQVYGSSLDTQLSLRTLVGGRMKTSHDNLLPLEQPSIESGSGFTTNCRGCTCFIAGDTRVNENPMLTIFHTLLVREHNRIAGHLAQSHSVWNDERLFQETRRIVVAQWQHIVYNEWLPAILGYHYCSALGLLPLSSGHSFIYLNTLFTNIANEFATAAFRLHSLIENAITYITSTGVSNEQSLVDSFFEPGVLTSPSLFTRMARGIVTQPLQKHDRHFSDSIRHHLFSDARGYGLDLVSLNIQRGRDHGIPSYVTVLYWCTSVKVTSWSSLQSVMSVESVIKLSSVYQHWQHIDLFVGINLETPVPGGVVGPTSRCLIAEQFIRLRYGDRFFYDLAGQVGSFTAPQLYQIRRTSWAIIMCNNVGSDFDRMQPMAFYQDSADFNNKLNCSKILSNQIDLSVF